MRLVRPATADRAFTAQKDSPRGGSRIAVTFWNGRGSTPRFVPVRRGVELNVNHDAEDVRISARRHVGRRLDVGTAEASTAGTVVHDHFDVTVGRNWNGSTFSGRAPHGTYVIVGRLVGDGVSPSAPMAFVFNVGASEATHEAAVGFRRGGSGLPGVRRELAERAGCIALTTHDPDGFFMQLCCTYDEMWLGSSGLG